MLITRFSRKLRTSQLSNCHKRLLKVKARSWNALSPSAYATVKLRSKIWQMRQGESIKRLSASRPTLVSQGRRKNSFKRALSAQSIGVLTYKKFFQGSGSNLATSGSLLARGPATLRIAIELPDKNDRSRRSQSACPTWRCRYGFLCFFANSTVFLDPPLKAGDTENRTVPSLSRTFHSVRRRYEAEVDSRKG
jgi:hypothetical protein